MNSDYQWKKGTAKYNRWIRGGIKISQGGKRKKQSKRSKRKKQPSRVINPIRHSDYGKVLIGWCEKCQWWSSPKTCVRCGDKTSTFKGD